MAGEVARCVVDSPVVDSLVVVVVDSFVVDSLVVVDVIGIVRTFGMCTRASLSRLKASEYQARRGTV